MITLNLKDANVFDSERANHFKYLLKNKIKIEEDTIVELALPIVNIDSINHTIEIIIDYTLDINSELKFIIDNKSYDITSDKNEQISFFIDKEKAKSLDFKVALNIKVKEATIFINNIQIKLLEDIYTTDTKYNTLNISRKINSYNKFYTTSERQFNPSASFGGKYPCKICGALISDNDSDCGKPDCPLA